MIMMMMMMIADMFNLIRHYSRIELTMLITGQDALVNHHLITDSSEGL